MAFDARKNFAYSTVATAPSPATSGTSVVVASGDGTKFPAVPFNATIWPTNAQPTTANAEIVRVTAISTDTLTITRAQESSTARTVVAGDQIARTVTAKDLDDLEGLLSVAFDTTDTLTASVISTTETAFTKTYDFPANYFTATRVVRVTAYFQYTSSATQPTLTLRTRVQKTGPTNVNLYVGAAATAGNSLTNNGSGFTFYLLGTAAPGAAANVHFASTMNSGTAFPARNTLAQPVAVDTTAAQQLQLTLQYGAATAGNTVTLVDLIVEQVA